MHEFIHSSEYGGKVNLNNLLLTRLCDYLLFDSHSLARVSTRHGIHDIQFKYAIR